jgi:hypothetical protein
MDQSPVTLTVKGSAEQVAIALSGMLSAWAQESADDMVERPELGNVVNMHRPSSRRQATKTS